MRSEFSGGLAEDAFEHAIELGERLEPDVVSCFADTAARIQELGLGVGREAFQVRSRKAECGSEGLAKLAFSD